MSTHLKNINAKIEIPRTDGSMVSDYTETTVFLNRFWGGKEREMSLQITFMDEESNYRHIQLDNKSVIELKRIIEENF